MMSPNVIKHPTEERQTKNDKKADPKTARTNADGSDGVVEYDPDDESSNVQNRATWSSDASGVGNRRAAISKLTIESTALHSDIVTGQPIHCCDTEAILAS